MCVNLNYVSLQNSSPTPQLGPIPTLNKFFAASAVGLISGARRSASVSASLSCTDGEPHPLGRHQPCVSTDP